ncbi:hypothetical protein QJS04_geneDACA024980 [Acorus gramineus]|uniref:Uncharacterized protein n=1 Tax=Acorus gramineus TaxID=55184 RepID=A0AAV9AJP6_ACOGR|nr:hypothetical protein QJS04_geneDACA024980 [Acorus gramineus]
MTEAESQAIHVEIQLDASEPVEEISPEFSVVTKNNSCTREDFKRSTAPVMLGLCRQFIAATLEPYLHAGFTALKNWWSSAGIYFCEQLQKFDVDDHAFATHIESFLSDCDAYHTARATLTMNAVSDTDGQLSSLGEEIRSFTKGCDVAMSELAVAKSKLDTAKSEEVAARIIFEEAQAHVTAASNIVSMKDQALNTWDIALTDKQNKQDHLRQLKKARVTDIRNVDVRRKELMQRLQNFSSIY